MTVKDNSLFGKLLIQWKNVLVFASLLIFLSIASACGLPDLGQYDRSENYSLDPIFRVFVRKIGGVDVVGPAISPLMEKGGEKVQFVEKGMLVYVQDNTDGGLVYLWPIGRELQVGEPTITTPSNMVEGALFINGHYLSPEFARYFTQIGGLAVAGNPLTEMNFNPFYQRYEQFFENVGFYQLKNSGDNKIHLLSYGSWMCGQNCAPGVDESAILDIDRPVSEPFLSFVNRLGRDFSGYLLKCKIDVPDSNSTEIKVFKNLVMSADPNSDDPAKLLPVPEIIGIEKAKPSPEKFEDRAVFIPTTSDGKGFNVPLPLMEYIDQHGGLSISGLPISLFDQYGDGFRQCFEYVCLTYQPDAVPWLQTQPDALGYFYVRLHPECKKSPSSHPGNAAPNNLEGENPGLRLQTWEEYPYITPGYAQTIYISVKDNLNRPLAGYVADLVVRVPDNNRNIYLTFPPTDASGQAKMEIPILVLPNGTLVPYQVCVGREEMKLCQEDDYVIWENP